MNEAQQLLEMRGQRNIGDDRFVGALTQKWSRMLTGVNHPNPKTAQHLRGCLAMLYENTQDHVKSITEDTLSTNVGSILKFIFPMLRNLFPTMIAPYIASVQPMSQPIGAAFYLDNKYGDTKGNVTANDSMHLSFNKYYTSEFVDYELKVASTSVDGTKTTWNDSTNAVQRQPFKWLPLRSYQDVGSAVYAVKLYYTSGGSLITLTDDGAGSLKDTAGATRGTINYTTGAWTLVAAAAPTAATPIYATYFYNSELIANTEAPAVSGSLYASTNQVAKVPTAGLDINYVELRAIENKLSMNWSIEAAEDLKAMQGEDAEAELVAANSAEIGLEIDRWIIDDMIANASHAASWAYGPAFGGANVQSEMQSIRTLLTMISSVSAKIHSVGKRRPANFLVVPPSIGALLDQLTTHSDYSGPGPMMVKPNSVSGVAVDYGIQMLGILSNKYTIYQDPYMDESKILVGYKGQSWLDAGYVYAPYQLLKATGTFTDPEDFRHKKGLWTRYAKKMLRPAYYGVINVSGVPTVTTT